MSELLWRALPGVRRAERSRFAFFFGLAALLSAGTTLGLAGSEALFLSGLGPGALPGAFVGASLATLLGSLLYAGAVGRARNDGLLVVLLIGTAASLVVDLVLLRGGSTAVLPVLFATFYISQAVFVSLHFWTFATDYFDTLASKRLFPLFAVGASAGGMLGGALAVAVSRTLSGDALVVVWAGLLIATALYVRLARGRLRRWLPVDASEADETSVEGLRGALRYLGRSPMAAWLAVSVIGMVFSLTLMQYLYLDIFSRSFATAEELATFFGAYLAITNGVEILVGNALTPWLIRRFGVAQANLAHPLLTVVTFGLLAVDPRLWVAVLARADRELLENALAGPIRALAYNALPHRFRGRMRALLEGVVFYSAMALAGGALVALGGRTDTAWLAALGIAAALLYAGANGIVRRAYLRSLVEGLREGRLELDAVAGGLGGRELDDLARQWEALLTGPSGRIPNAVLEIARPLAARGQAPTVAGQVDHPDPRVRSAALDALVAAGAEHSGDHVARALTDGDPGVRRTAAGLAHRVASRTPALEAALAAHGDDPDAGIRADLALARGPEGMGTLVRMARSPDPDVVRAALGRLPAGNEAVAEALVGHADPGVRAGAIECLTRLGAHARLPAERLVAGLADESALVRRSAAAALGHLEHPSAATALAGALDDDSRAVRLEARSALVRHGEAGVRAALPVCRSPRLWTAEAALAAVAGAGGPAARHPLRTCFADRVREAWWTRLALEHVPAAPDPPRRYLRAILANAHRHARTLAFHTLEHLEEPTVVRSVARTLVQAGPRSRADALEVLSNLGDRPSAHRFALLLETGAVADARAALSGFVEPPDDWRGVLAAAAGAPDRWLRWVGTRYGDGASGADGPPAAADAAREETMERLLALQRVPLFGHLSLEQLEIIDRVLQEARFIEGEVIVREGDAATDLFILVEGEVGFYTGWGTPAEECRSVMKPVGYFGEIAILDGEPRSATALAAGDARLLKLASTRLRELILQSPEIAFEIFPVLTARLRTAEARISELKAGG